MELIYQGFDRLEVSFQGLVSHNIRKQLASAKAKAQEDNKEVLVRLGKNKTPVLVEPTGIRGYQFVLDTGIDREKWFIADNNKSERWNIRVVVKSLSLATMGYKKAKKNIYQFLEDIEAKGKEKDDSLLERISRFDYCFDFRTGDFVINPKMISAHSNSTRQFIGGQELISRNKDIEYIRIGKMPNRQIVFYDKTKEVISTNKWHWWDIWKLNGENFDDKIWRVEIRAGKEELNSWGLKRFEDFEKIAGDVLLGIANAIRYVKPNYRDSNKARWKNKEFWDKILLNLETKLFEFRSNSKRNVLLMGFKAEKISEYQKLFLNLIPPYMAISGKSPENLEEIISELSGVIESSFSEYPEHFAQKVDEAKDRFVFFE